MTMKSVMYGAVMTCAIAPTFAFGYSDRSFRREVLAGLDIVSVQTTVDETPDVAPGQLGADVYMTVGAVDKDTRLFIPTSMYMRAGAGMNLPFATSGARVGDKEHDVHSGWGSQIGLGWNLSSYVRAELDLQQADFEFKDIADANASLYTLGGTLYFDFARRYVQTGDITHRRRFVPFMGIGAGIGANTFSGANGATDFVFAAPRGILGINVMFTDLIGIDLSYQYQMIIGGGFGWNTTKDTTASVSSIMATLRANF